MSENSFHCELCSKTLKSSQSYRRHLLSKKHLTKKNNILDVEKEEKRSSVPHIVISDKNQNINYLYHLSDIHIFCEKRHTEYQEQFNKFIDCVNKQTFSHQETALVITGDFLDNKNRITPSQIILARKFVITLAQKFPVFIIAGNHDKNLNYIQSEDNISAIIDNGSIPHKNIHYLKKTGSYQYNNITFGVSSVFDYRMVTANEIPRNERKIALFHGGVGKYMLFNGHSQKNELVPVSLFEGYDCTLLGDIHKWQFLNTKKNIAYAGSMIQKNHGEDWQEHGYLLWDLKKKTATHHSLPNEYRFVTLEIIDGNLITVTRGMPKNLYVRWKIINTQEKITSKNEAQEKIRKTFNVLEECYVKCPLKKTKYHHGPKNFFELSLTEQEKYAKEWLLCEKEKINLSEWKKLNQEYNQTAKKDLPEAFSWKLKELQFSNIFCYEKPQKIHFDMEGIHGIVAPNHAGKSAIFDILLFTLFGKCTRSDAYSYMDLVHAGSNNKQLHCSLTLETIEKQEKIKITRQCTKKRQSMVVTIEKNGQPFYKGSSQKANVMITKIIGTYEDFMTTTVHAQQSVHNFLLMSGKAQKDFTARLFRLDLYDKLHRLAKKDLSKKKSQLQVTEKRYSEKAPTFCSKKLQQVKEETDTLEKKLNKCSLSKRELTVEREEWFEKIKTLLPQDTHLTLKELQQEKNELLDQMEALEKEKTSLEEEEEISLEKISQLQEEIAEKRNQKPSTQVLDELWKQVIKWNRKSASLRKEKCLVYNKKGLFKTKQKKLLKYIKQITTYQNELIEKEKALPPVLDPVKLQKELYQCLTDLPRENEGPSDWEKTYSGITEYNGSEDDEQLIAFFQKDVLEKEAQLKTLTDSLSQKPEESEEILREQFEKSTRQVEKQLYQQKTRQKQITEYQELEKKLDKYPYDPQCKYCCQNPFVKEAKEKIKQLPQLLKEEKENKIVILKQKRKEVRQKLKQCLAWKKTQRKISDKKSLLEDSQFSLKKWQENKLNSEKRAKILEEKKTIEDKIKNTEKILEEKRVFEKKHIAIADCLHEFILLKRSFEEESEKYFTQKEAFSKTKDEIVVIEEKIVKMKKYLEIEKKHSVLQKSIWTLENQIRIAFQNQELKEKNTFFKKKIKEQEEDLSTLAEEEQRLQSQLMEKKYWLQKESEKETQLKKLQKELQKIQQETHNLSLYVKMTHHNGIPALLLRKITKTIENSVNQVLEQYSTMRVRMENEGKETIIRVIQSGKKNTLNAKMLCGSEKFLVELAFRVSFQTLSAVSKPNFMICDEGWSCLDEKSRSNMSSLLEALLQHNDFILTVSHLQDVRMWMNESIQIKIQNKDHIIEQNSNPIVNEEN